MLSGLALFGNLRYVTPPIWSGILSNEDFSNPKVLIILDDVYNLGTNVRK